ncbi:DUF1150 family protein [Phycobacter azelaicus]|jgi:hypothetical protein|uniref:DUF1150 family protein n=1 Tax=Phycobacter azelaicus TaxID=2668075 RepID=UPI0018691CC0|nr:DUF1150 family protein [Phycobacter azelaicus]MBE1296627.1 DUF1150 family protein [Paracoccaceae bacterium]
MHTPFDFNETGKRIVYVKAVDVADLPADVQAGAQGRKQLYAVHDAEGEQLALVADRRMAFVLARQNDLSPVTVH